MTVPPRSTSIAAPRSGALRQADADAESSSTVKRLALLVALVLSLSLAGAAEAHDTVSFTVLPGAFDASLEVQGDLVVLTVEDATGSGQGWWVTVQCDCTVVALGEPRMVAGQAIDAEGGPHLAGQTLIAEPGHGQGLYTLAFRALPGNWTVTSGRAS
jgi:hypothetical protein